MKKWSLVPLLAFCLFGFTLEAQVYSGRDANNLVNGSELVRLKSHTSIPDFIRLRVGSEVPIANFESWMSQFFKQDPAWGFQVIREEKDEFGFTHIRYQQTYNNIPLEQGIFMAHAKNGLVVSVNGELFDKVNAQQAALSESQALTNALNYVGAATYRWEIPGEEQHLKWETGDPNATYYPHGDLVYFNADVQMKRIDIKPAFRFNIYAFSPESRADIFVDATTGDILFESNHIHTADSNGTVVTGYSGTHPMTADFTGTNFRLRETGRGNGIETFNALQQTNLGNAVDFTDTDNFWDNANAQLDEFAGDAHWGAEMTYDYLLLKHNRNSIDNNGFLLRSYVHVDQNWFNASWDGQRMRYGDGNNNNPLTALDITGHEIAHGLTTFTADLVYAYESGALNESFSDIFGTAIEFFAKPTTANWLVGEDTGFPLRSMSNPNIEGHPDTYLGTNWHTDPSDNGGVHVNSGVQNYWFYLLTEGGTGTNDNGDAFNVTAIGIDDAAAVAFRNLTVYLTNSSQFADARFYAIQSAIDVFGPCTQQVESTTNAWYAVGVGPEYVAGVNSDFVSPLPTSCTVPHTVDFINYSSNGSTFFWDFGDGNTSTDPNPTHTYSTTGNYDVLLVSTSTCGVDSLTVTDFVQIGPGVPCILVLPTTGSAITQDACEGKMYDDGGLIGNYSDNSDVTVTISPFGAGSVTLSFISFAMEAGNQGPGICNFDYLEVFDGPTTASTSLGQFCGTTPPPPTLTSTGSSITLRQVADGGVSEAGFEIDWSCNAPTTPPIVNFEANTTTTCNGVVSFNELTTNGVTGWSWNFGDGGISTDQNPIHTYVTNGLYTVTLVATNVIGSATEAKTSYIAVNRPEIPATISADICPNESATLSAIGSGETRWYDADTGGNLIQVGDSFTTPVLTASAGYWAENVTPGTTQFGGAPDIGIGTGGNFNNGAQYQIFDAFQEFELKSVNVFANGAGNRTIQLRTSAGVVIEETTVNINSGMQNVLLNFTVPVGSDLQLGLSPTSPEVDLYRNNNGPNYPYTLPGILSITRSSAGTTPFSFYYFFYNWEVVEYCRSERQKVFASMAICTGVEEVLGDETSVTIFPNPTRNTMQIQIDMPQSALVEINLLDARGSRLRQLTRQELTEGDNQLSFNLAGVANGFYFAQIISGDKTIIRKVAVSK